MAERLQSGYDTPPAHVAGHLPILEIAAGNDMTDERFGDLSRILRIANREARRRNHEYVGTEHLLIAVMRESNDDLASKILRKLGISADNIRSEVDGLVQRGPEVVTMGKLPQTPRAKKVFEYAMEEAGMLNPIRIEHILLGLMREKQGIAWQALVNLGLTLDRVRVVVQDCRISDEMNSQSSIAPKDEYEPPSEAQY